MNSIRTNSPMDHKNTHKKVQKNYDDYNSLQKIALIYLL